MPAPALAARKKPPVAEAPAPVQPSVRAGVELWRTGDYPAAVAMWTPFASAGDADAMFNIGQAYKLGRAVPKDVVIARDWYRRAALKGHLPAQANLGILLFQAGEKQEAIRWLRAAADKNEMRAQYVLGVANWNGDSIPRNLTLAYAYLSRAAAQGLPEGTSALVTLSANLSAIERANGAATAASLAAGNGVPSVFGGPPPVALAAAPDRFHRDQILKPAPVQTAAAQPAVSAAQAQPAPVQPAPVQTAAVRPAPVPAPAAVRPPVKPAPVQTAAIRPAPVPAPAAARPPVQTVPVQTAPVQTAAIRPAPPPAQTAMVVQPPPPAARPAPAVSLRPAAPPVRTVDIPAAVSQQLAAAPAPAAARAPAPAPKPVAPPVARPTEVAVLAKPAPPPAARPIRKEPPEWRVQLGAFSQKALAEAAWDEVKVKQKQLVAANKPIFASDGAVTRLQMGPFASREKARDACARIAFSGRACFVTEG
ncbi:hypothetical protein GCM10011529_09870 [Polymorphobacter glacialis]|uniref:SPOR domain-containing protein n=2 Tax=Sandarakinorhabdus glacialis TaxID=1614636 RepID=A0A916ZNP5_9SPHN|nr:hypothetical protein GCM10011529_09870 [Polymorphobacter glacialis]